jgi:replication factor C subunit 3/5
MSLWADKYRPQSLDKLTYHNDLSAHLKKMVRSSIQDIGSDQPQLATNISWLKAHSGDFPHMLFYGPPGAGKKTRIAAVLREIYGPGVERVRISKQTIGLVINVPVG